MRYKINLSFKISDMKKYIVLSKPLNFKSKAQPKYGKRQIFEAENPAEAICKANNENNTDGFQYQVVGVYEQVWHI